MLRLAKQVCRRLAPGIVLVLLVALGVPARAEVPDAVGAPVVVPSTTTVALSEFLDDVDRGKVKNVEIDGPWVTSELADGGKTKTYMPDGASLINILHAKKIHFNIAPKSNLPGAGEILLYLLPVFLMIGLWVMTRKSTQQPNPGNAIGSFSKSKAKKIEPDDRSVNFGDVAGVDEAKQDLEEVVDFLRDPKKFARLGGRVPKGVLLVGPPGTGKTLLARAVAGEAGVPFFFTSGSDFVEMYVGVGASRVRDLFAQAKNSAPCIVFIDEIDAVGRHRGSGMGSGNEEREQTLNQLLVEMDGFQPNSGIIVIAATNRSDILDKALTRPGRFDREVVVSNPDLIGRQKILQTHAKKIALHPGVDVRVIARGTPGFSGAELANLVNEAALLAARSNDDVVGMHHFEAAKDKVLMGAERRSLAMSESERQLTAYHEAGHALVSLALPASDPIHKATIVPRGGALGMVMRLPEGDRVSMTREKLEADLAVAMGGRCAEGLIFGRQKVTTGAQGDIAQATRLARKMVTEWGMSDSLGLMAYVAEDGGAPGAGAGGGLSEEMGRRVDAEVRRLLDEAYARANAILTARQADLRRIAQGLLDYETLTGSELRRVAQGLPLEREDVLPPSGDGKASEPMALPIPANQPTPEPVEEPVKVRAGGAAKIGRFDAATVTAGNGQPT